MMHETPTTAAATGIERSNLCPGTLAACEQVTTLASLNDALKPINMEVAGAQEGPVSQVEWSVRDGRSLYRFTDDMVWFLIVLGPQGQGRRSSLHRTGAFLSDAWTDRGQRLFGRPFALG